MQGDAPVSWLMFFTFAAAIFIIAGFFIRHLHSQHNRDIAANALAGDNSPRVGVTANGALADLSLCAGQWGTYLFRGGTLGTARCCDSSYNPALTFMCGFALAQTSTGPAGQQDNMTKPGMTNGSMEKGSMNNGASGGTSNGTTGAVGGDMSTKGGQPDSHKTGAMTGGVAGTPGTASGGMSK